MFINKFSKIFILLKLTNYLSFATAALDLNDIESIFNYFNGIEHNAVNHYYLNVKLNDEINGIINRIYNDQIKILDELKNMSKNFEDADNDREWNSVISFIESYGLKDKLKKHNIYQLSKLKETVNCIDRRIDHMIKAIDNINEIRKSNVEHNFCSHIFSTAFIFLQSLSFESVFDKYRELVQIIRFEMESIINVKVKKVIYTKKILKNFNLHKKRGFSVQQIFLACVLVHPRRRLGWQTRGLRRPTFTP